MSAAWAFFALLSGGLWLGFVLHHSGGEGLLLGRYTASYAGLLAAITFVWLAALAFAWRRRANLAGWLKSVFGSVFVTLILAAIVLPLAYIYLHQRSLDDSVFKPLGEDAHAFTQIDKTPLALPKTDDGLRILAIGGSTTYGSKLEREQTYPAQLQALLRERFAERPITVLNAGVPWHTSMHSLTRYVTRFADWKPDVVIVMHAFNDIYQTSEGRLTSGRYRSDYGHFFGALGERVNPVDRFATDIGKVLTGNWLARTWYSDLRRAAGPAASSRARVDLLRPLPDFRRNLTRLARIAAKDGATVVLMTQPYSYRPGMSAEEKKSLFYPFYYKDYARVPAISEQTAAMDRFNQTTREVAAATDSVLIDLEPRIEKRAAILYDDVHYTAAGAHKVAEQVLEQGPWPRLIKGDEP